MTAKLVLALALLSFSSRARAERESGGRAAKAVEAEVSQAAFAKVMRLVARGLWDGTALSVVSDPAGAARLLCVEFRGVRAAGDFLGRIAADASARTVATCAEP